MNKFVLGFVLTCSLACLHGMDHETRVIGSDYDDSALSVTGGVHLESNGMGLVDNFASRTHGSSGNLRDAINPHEKVEQLEERNRELILRNRALKGAQDDLVLEHRRFKQKISNYSFNNKCLARQNADLRSKIAGMERVHREKIEKLTRQIADLERKKVVGHRQGLIGVRGMPSPVGAQTISSFVHDELRSAIANTHRSENEILRQQNKAQKKQIDELQLALSSVLRSGGW